MSWSVVEFVRAEPLEGGSWYGIVVITNAETNEEEGLRLKFPSEPLPSEALALAEVECARRNEEAAGG